MKLIQLEIFHYVGKTHSFTKAAEQLDLSKGYVSAQISELEKEIKTKLINRTTRHLSLTEAGSELLVIAENIVLEKQKALNIKEQFKEEPSGLLTISAPASISESLLSPILPKFLEKHPKIKLNIITSANVKNLAREGIDIALRVTTSPDEMLIAKLIASFEFLISATPEYLSQQPKIKHPKDLKEHNCLIYTSDPVKNNWLFGIKSKMESITVSGNLNSTNHLVIKNTLLNHLGVTRLPRYTIQKEIDDGLLVPILEDYSDLKLPVYAIFAPSKAATAPKIKAFITFLQKHFSKA